MSAREERPHGASGRQIAERLAARLAHLPAGSVVGISGAQGSGKSTLTGQAAEVLEQRHGRRCLVLSLDDFYHSRDYRQNLAEIVHPLCATRGVPGTHDVRLIANTLARLKGDGCVALPHFDKLADDRASPDEWSRFQAPADLILFEGWCVGVRRDDLPDWQGPINVLEAEADPDGRWFAWSLASLSRDYEAMWDRLALLISIEVPDFETIIDSRLRQEQMLAAGSSRSHMDRAALTRFVQHYERYTRALWPAMRARADILLARDRSFELAFIRE